MERGRESAVAIIPFPDWERIKSQVPDLRIKLESNRLPFSLAKPEGSAGGIVTLENLRIEKQGI